MNTTAHRYFGDLTFYKKVSQLAFPLALQQLLGSAMEMVDSLMVSWIGQVSAVGCASQIHILANTIIWGMLSGTNIFTAQFYGAKDDHNLKRTFAYSLVICLGNALFWVFLASFFGREILSFYMQDETVVQQALNYLSISRFSLIPAAIAFTFSYTYRTVHEVSLTVKVSIFSMFLNICLNSLLIFGLGPFEAMGVQGAALASLISQWASVLIYTVYALKTQQPFIGRLEECFAFDRFFIQRINHKIVPLVINETLFGFGTTLFVKAFSVLGKPSIEAYYIGEQIANFFSFIIWGYGAAVSIIIGHLLGEEKIVEPIRESRWFITLSALLSALLVICLCIAPLFVGTIYQIKDSQILLNTQWILPVFAYRLAFRLFNFMIFSVLRAGGDSRIISFLDAGLMYGVGIPLAFISIYVFGLENIALVYFITQSEQVVRFILGMKRYLSGKWAVNLTA